MTKDTMILFRFAIIVKAELFSNSRIFLLLFTFEGL